MAAFVSEISTAHRSAWTIPVLVYVGFVLACIALLHPTAMQMAGLWLQSSSHHHGALVAPIALWMILERPRVTPSTNILSIAGVFIACALWLAGNAAGVALIEQVAFVSLLIAGAGAIFGGAAMKQWAAPLLFLYFMVPFGAVLIPPMQMATANAVVTMLGAVGMPVSLDGILIRTPAGLFEIAEACAGLNFLLAALMIASIYACQFLRTSNARLHFILLAVIVALFANFLRVFLLIAIATVTEMKIAVGPDHLVFGLIFYGVVLAALIWIGERTRRREPAGVERTPSMMFKPWRSLVAFSALLPIAAASLYASEIVNAPVDRNAPSALSPLNAPGWRILAAPANWRPPINADRLSGATYVSRDGTVYASMSYFTHDRPENEIITYNNRAWDGADWRRIGTAEEMVYMFGSAQMTPIDLLAGPEGRRLAAITAYWRGGDVFFEPSKFKTAQLFDKIKGHNPEGGVIILAASYQSDPAEALHTLRPFTHEVEDFSKWRARNSGDN